MQSLNLELNNGAIIVSANHHQQEPAIDKIHGRPKGKSSSKGKHPQLKRLD